jgi:protein XagA
MDKAIQTPAIPRPSRRLPGLWLVALLATTGPVPAIAGAFNAPAGQGLAILRGTFDAGDESYDIHGHLIKTAPYQKGEASIYIQYGVTDWLQAIIKPDLVSTRLSGTTGGHYTGIGTSEAGAQLRLLVFGPAVLAVQGTFHLPYTTRERNFALIGNTSRDTDGRALLGVSFNLGSWPSFVDAEVGYRIRNAGAPDEVHLDATLGTRPWPTLLVLVQSFTTISIGAGIPWFPNQQYTNIEGSFVVDLDPHWSLQVGVFTTVEGRNALRERALETSLWYRF